MKVKRVNFKSRIGLTLLFALMVMLTLIITAAIITFVVFAAFNTEAHILLRRRDPYLPLAILIIVSLGVGFAVSCFVSRFALSSIKKIISAANSLAAGDFSTRLHLKDVGEWGRLSASFNKMAEELANNQVLRSDFVNNFSHEFKTPIVSIKGFAEMLRYADLTADERNEYLDIIIGECGRLSRLASNVLSLTKIENQKILTDLSAFNLGEQIRESVILLAPKWETRRQYIDAEVEDIKITGNKELLSQIWVNLLDNAIKFSPECAQIAITLKRAGNNTVYSVKNSGTPLSADQKKRVFDKFYQTDLSHSTQGNGLGLTIAKKIAELHGGAIEVSCTDDGEITFTVTLPVNRTSKV